MNIRMFQKSALLSLTLMLSGQLALASPTLQEGSHGHDVLLLQKKLQAVGYNISSVDGVFGAETEQAVAEFQRDNKIRITGVVNNATWRALQKAKKAQIKAYEEYSSQAIMNKLINVWKS